MRTSITVLLLIFSVLSWAPSFGAVVPSITIYDGSVMPLQPTERFKGVPVLKNGQPTQEIRQLSQVVGRNLLSPEAIKANTNLKIAEEFFRVRLGRAGFDGKNHPIRATVNLNQYGIDLFGLRENAAWISTLGIFVFGRGTPEGLKAFTDSLEVVGHEFTHAVIDSTSKLEYAGQSGALNEHFADVFGAMIRYHHLDGKVADPFLIGEKILGTRYASEAVALRDMARPWRGLGDQPHHVSLIDSALGPDCKPSSANDQCGVHILSGIHNRASAMILRRLGWDRTPNLFYTVMTEDLEPKSSFSDYRNALEKRCPEYFGETECRVVGQAFDLVGIE